MNTAYFYLTDEGGKLAHKLATAHPGDIYNKENFKENLRAGFGKYDSLVCIMQPESLCVFSPHSLSTRRVIRQLSF